MKIGSKDQICKPLHYMRFMLPEAVERAILALLSMVENFDNFRHLGGPDS